VQCTLHCKVAQVLDNWRRDIRRYPRHKGRAIPSATTGAETLYLLGREDVGVEEVGEGVWSVFYGPVHLGWLDEADSRIMDVRGKKRRKR
jgi:hypothetical protein